MYSIGPSCGSAPSLVIPYSESSPGRGRPSELLLAGSGVVCFSDSAGDFQGEATRAGSTKENREAIMRTVAVVKYGRHDKRDVWAGDDARSGVSV